MNNKVILGIVAVIIIVGAVFLATRPKSTSDVASDSQSAQSATETKAETGSIKSLIAAGGDRKCTFKSTEQGVESSGTMYISGGKMRGDFSSTVEGKATGSHMIYDGQISYVWMDGMSQGFKMAFDASQYPANNNQQSVDVNKNYEFDCSNWSADNSRFDVPDDIQFLETSSYMNTNTSVTAPAANSSDVKKAACNNLPEPAKTQCLNAVQ